MRKTTTLAAVTAAMVLAGQAYAADLKIGVLYPTSGGGAIYGVPAMVGHDMAVEEINAAGGINGMMLKTFAITYLLLISFQPITFRLRRLVML
jgi:branched-chain amino acid transport system substrate-binding protein